MLIISVLACIYLNASLPLLVKLFQVFSHILEVLYLPFLLFDTGPENTCPGAWVKEHHHCPVPSTNILNAKHSQFCNIYFTSLVFVLMKCKPCRMLMCVCKCAEDMFCIYSDNEYHFYFGAYLNSCIHNN